MGVSLESGAPLRSSSSGLVERECRLNYGSSKGGVGWGGGVGGVDCRGEMVRSQLIGWDDYEEGVMRDS